MHHHIKDLFIAMIWDKVNAINAGMAIGAIYFKTLLAVQLPHLAPNVFTWLQGGIVLLSCGFLCAYNALKFYRLWKSDK